MAISSPHESNFNPIIQTPIAEKVVYHILSLVQSGNLKAADKLPSEKELMTLFDVSRPTLREALRALSILGITETKKGSGTHISNLDAEKLLAPLSFYINLDNNNLSDTFECRRILESEMVAKAAVNVTDIEIVELERLLVAQEGVIDDPIGFRIADQQFHELLADIARNSVLKRVVTGMYNIGMESRRKATDKEGVIGQSICDHRKIVAALKIRDPIAASHAMDSHLSQIELSTKNALEDSLVSEINSHRH